MIPIFERLSKRLLMMPSGCLEWQGARNPKGYGQIGVIDPRGTEYTHRVAWEEANGPIPDGKCVLHRCDNPPCCNAWHLWLGTQTDNLADMRAKGRQGDPSKLTEGQIAAIRIDSRLQRVIAAEYGVSRGMVGHILCGRRRKKTK